jgi:hypothetical protein
MGEKVPEGVEGGEEGPTGLVLILVMLSRSFCARFRVSSRFMFFGFKEIAFMEEISWTTLATPLSFKS